MHKRNVGLGSWVIVTAGIVAVAAVYACSSDDTPASTPTTDAGQDAPMGQPEAAADTGACVDPPDCIHCADLLTARCRSRATTCNCNTPKSTTAISADISRCACMTQCATECAVSCGGQGDPSQACIQCEAQKCLPEITACAQDFDPIDPTCNPMPPQMDAGSDASDASDDAADAADD